MDFLFRLPAVAVGLMPPWRGFMIKFKGLPNPFFLLLLFCIPLPSFHFRLSETSSVFVFFFFIHRGCMDFLAFRLLKSSPHFFRSVLLADAKLPHRFCRRKTTKPRLKKRKREEKKAILT